MRDEPTSAASRASDSSTERHARLRRASTLNILLPGAGQFYLGQKRLGLGLLAGFLVPFFAAVAVFLVSMNRYFTIVTSTDLLEGRTLENLGAVFHLPWLIAFTSVAVADFLLSMALLWFRPIP
jgi:hypothetical protein